MKRAVIVMMFVVGLTLLPAPLRAQGGPKTEVFGGFSVHTLTPEGWPTRITPLGWEASVAGHLSSMFAIVGDVGYQYKGGIDYYQYLGGVQFTRRLETTSAFVHALYGLSHDGSGGETFTQGYGGGFDVNSGHGISIRVLQFDWLPRHKIFWVTDSFRFGTGIVFKFGSR